MFRQVIFIICQILFISVVSQAQEMPYRNSIQTDPISALLGNYKLICEHRFNAENGMIAEGIIADSREVEGYNVSLHFRRYKAQKPRRKKSKSCVS